MAFTCFKCGQSGHVAANCAWQAELEQAPPGQPDKSRADWPRWCGSPCCDPMTRQVDHGDYVTRCLECHPRSHLLLTQHRRCDGCRSTIVKWDTLECGKHLAILPDRLVHVDRTPAQVPVSEDHLRWLAAEQVAESRRQRDAVIGRINAETTVITRGYL